MPAGHFGVVIEDVADVPAEDDVAEPGTRFRRRPEFVQADVFAAQRAVDVERAEFDALNLMLVEELADDSSSI